MQIKTRMRYHYIPLEWQKYRTLTTPNAEEDVEQQELSFTAGQSAKWGSHLGRHLDGFLQN